MLIKNPKHQRYITKLYLNEYSPFEETLFIDADSFVVSSLDHLWNLFKYEDFTALGGVMTNRAFNPNLFLNIAKLKTPYNLESYPGFNGGVYYFKKNTVSDNVFKTAQDLIKKYDYFEMPYYGNSKGDEPLFSLAMAINGCRSVLNPVNGMYLVSSDYNAFFNLNLLKNTCRLINQKNEIKKPAIAHFGTMYTYSLIYKREAFKLSYKWQFPKKSILQINILASVIYNPIIFCVGQFQRFRFYKLGVFKFLLIRTKLALKYKIFGFSNFLYLSVKLNRS